jgi:hypothetical protein
VCRICGSEHYIRHPHDFKGTLPSDHARPDKPCVNCKVKDATIVELRAKITALESNSAAKKSNKSNGAFDKQAYQRKYMAKRRSAQKEQHNG